MNVCEQFSGSTKSEACELVSYCTLGLPQLLRRAADNASIRHTSDGSEACCGHVQPARREEPRRPRRNSDAHGWLSKKPLRGGDWLRIKL